MWAFLKGIVVFPLLVCFALAYLILGPLVLLLGCVVATIALIVQFFITIGEEM